MHKVKYQVMHRDPCSQCGVRADVGCSHRPPSPPEFVEFSIRDESGSELPKTDDLKDKVCPICGIKTRKLGVGSHMFRMHPNHKKDI